MNFAWIDIKAAELGTTKKAIANEANICYMKFCKIKNGYQSPESEPGFTTRVKAAIRRLEKKITNIKVYE